MSPAPPSPATTAMHVIRTIASAIVEATHGGPAAAVPASTAAHIAALVASASAAGPASSSSAPLVFDLTAVAAAGTNGPLLERAVLAYDAAHATYHLALWPMDVRVPAARIAFSATKVAAELLPCFLDEDVALDWHAALRDACLAADVDYAAAKVAADKAFRSATGDRYRGIGGIMLQSLPAASADVVRAFVVPAVRVVLEAVTRAASIADSLEGLTDAARRQVAPAPVALTADEAEWAAWARSQATLALASAGIPHACLPPSARFPTATPWATQAHGTTGFAAAHLDVALVPRRARTLAAAMATPRPSYIETLFVQALRGCSVPRAPVWLHRQAGRYLPEYLKLKGDKNFLDMTADPKIAAEITMQPVWRYSVDCAIIFSDIMTIPQALGMELKMQPGPFFPHPIRTLEDIERLAYQPEIMQHVYDALVLTRSQLARDKALVGFCGGPWTLMAYMIGKDLAKKWLHMHPEWAHLLLRKCADVAIDYLAKQIDAGADVVQVFESNAADLGPDDFYEFALPYLKDIAVGVKLRHPNVPMTLFPRGANYATARIARETIYDAISVDWAGVPSEARAAAGPYVTLQGNLEPDVMYEPVDNIKRKVRAMINAFGKHRYIVNLGHGTKLDMSVDAVGAFVEEAQTIVQGSRNSPLAMAQARLVEKALATAPHAEKLRAVATAQSGWAPPSSAHRFRIDGVATKGDKVLDVALAKIGDKGLFTKELEVSLLAGDVAFVQHSLKDLETELPAALTLASVLPREDRRDALVSRSGHKYTLATLPKGATVGSSSLRRRAQIAAARPDIHIVDIRGNLNTRLAKLLGEHAATKTQAYDAIVLAVAGLKRLPGAESLLARVHVEPVAESQLVPAVSQGAVGVQTRAVDLGLVRLARGAQHGPTRVACDHERAFLRAVQGGCQVPVAVATSLIASGTTIEKVVAHIWSVDGKRHLTASATSGVEAAEKLLALGADAILAEIRV
ncbi:Uroporphyrinogen decarboxylase-domain-containing protein [Blastocladiella britannica]|nr:Uroporphyrinogen decarboxylase-domain-containing protein [Blastocladiella britannica]